MTDSRKGHSFEIRATRSTGVAFSQPALIALTTVVLLTLAVRLPTLAIPFERDEGEYAYIGWRLG